MRIKESIRIKDIESKWNFSIEKLLYDLHWQKDLMHHEIGRKLNVPRSTITRWFKLLKIPSRDSHRITRFNLLNVGPNKTEKAVAKKKFIPKFFVNQRLFEKWSNKMAYVLGYFIADGCMFINPRGSHYIEFTSIDKELIVKTRNLLSSNHKIGKYNPSNQNWKTSYRLQIGSKKIFNDLLRLGLTPRKSKCINLHSSIPKIYFADFARGYFDGDGYINVRFYKNKKSKKKIVISTGFCSGTKLFLEMLLSNFRKHAGLKGGFIVNKKDGNFELCFSINDSIKLYHFMYDNVEIEEFLERKHDKFQKALKYLRA